ncbi:MAG: MurR/RpiR family transcriptional regulator [Desulfobacterales bacterium]|nr:MurR/RpiR family transcriptional regulator [Desulfobacterales bacterium]
MLHTQDVLSTIQASILDLRNSEKKVAEYVLRHPEEVMKSSITTLAENAGTSEPTVIRFCRQIKLSGFMDLKLKLAQSLPRARQDLENVGYDDPVPEIVNKMFQSAEETIGNTHRHLNMADVEKAVALLSKAERIEFYGAGGAGILALDAQHKFFRLGIPCIAYTDSHMQSMSAALLGPSHVVVAFSHSGATKDTIESAGIAKENGAGVIGIQGETKTPLSKYCDIVLASHSEEVALRLAPMASRLAQLAIVDCLLVAVAHKGGNRIDGNLARVKQVLIGKRY